MEQKKVEKASEKKEENPYRLKKTNGEYSLVENSVCLMLKNNSIENYRKIWKMHVQKLEMANSPKRYPRNDKK